MKKYLSFVLCLVLAVFAVASSPVGGVAAENATGLPEFDYPTMSYPTFAETGIPYQTLKDFLPENIEVKHEGDTLYVKGIGGDNAYYTDYLDYDSHKGEFKDGCWQFTVSADAYHSGGALSIYATAHAWSGQYDINGKRGIVYFTTYVEGRSRAVMLYPEAGYGEQYVQVSYDLLSGVRVTDSYAAGILKEQMVEYHDNTASVWVKYDASGNVIDVDVSPADTGEYFTFISGKGWSENSWEYAPVAAPAGFEDYTLERFTATWPTDIGCTHRWEGPYCDAPAICAVCQREKGAPTGHSWVTGSHYDTCATCNGQRYPFSPMAMPDFAAKPCQSLKEAGIDMGIVTANSLEKIEVKYENGILMVPGVDGCSFRARIRSESYVNHMTIKGWHRIEIAEEKLAKLELRFSSEKVQDGNAISYTLRYDPEGNPLSLNVYDAESRKSIYVSFADDTVELSYRKDKKSNIEYTDVYQDGYLTARGLFDSSAGTWVYYNADLQVEWVEVLIRGKYFKLTPGQGWSVDGDAVAAPEGYAEKDGAYFAEAYPHGIEFCVHTFAESADANTKRCAKCGYTAGPAGLDVIVIIVVALVAVLAVAGIILAVKKKKAK